MVKCGLQEVSTGPKKTDILCWAFAAWTELTMMKIATVGPKPTQPLGKRHCI